jgi:hypothetical protein
MSKGFVWVAVLAIVSGAAWADEAPPAESPAAGRLVAKTYPVAELVAPWPAFPAPAAPLGTFRPVDPRALQGAEAPIRAAACSSAACTAPPGLRENAAALVRLIKATVKPYSWEEMGGSGRVEFHENGMALVVNQTADVQAQVAELLTALRRLQDAGTVQVVLELRVLEVPTAVAEKVGADCGPTCKSDGGCPRHHGAVCLSGQQIAALTEAAQADRRTRTLMAPKLIALDMQQAVIQVGGVQVFQTGLELTAGPDGVSKKPRFEAAEVGTRITATPKVSADRRFVRLRLLYETASVNPVVPATPVAVGATEPGESPPDVLARPAVDIQAVETTVAIPDGGTVLVPGPVMTREERTEFGPPVLSRIPYVSRIVVNKGIGRETHQQLILVTAKVMTPPKEGGECCPAAGCKGCPACEKVAAAKPAECPADPELAKLVAAYRKACADGRTEEAMKLAMQALARDPKCFAAEK